MGLSSAVGWWEEWQLRVLVLTSIFMQYLLFLFSFMRKLPSLRRLRVLLWIVYIAGDAVAIYALATLFNRRKKTWDRESTSDLEVLWAPVLLIHLGGQPWISGYSLEDNELWKRHTITLVSQVVVALYVFCKWWSGEKTLLAAAILLFVIGILRFAQKPWALKTASFNNMQTSSSTVSLVPKEQIEERIHSLEDYVQVAKKCVLDTTVDSEYWFGIESGYMFIDLSVPYSFRIAQLPSFLKLRDKAAYHQLKGILSYTFDFLYGKRGTIFTKLGIGLMLLLPFLALASTVLFATSHKDGHNVKDIKVTYILFACTTVLELLFPCVLISLITPLCGEFFARTTGEWHDMVSQYNLISFCVRKKKPTFLMKFATFSFLREFINKYWYVQNIPIAFLITGVVRRHVKHGWEKYICDAASYRRFSELQGQWAIRRHHQLSWSLKKPFDERILIWHLATDLCFYHPKTSPQCPQGKATKHSRVISNYMVYLLFIHPEMLMPGTRSDHLTLASNQIFENTKGPSDKEESLLQEILNIPMLPPADDMISRARRLTEALMELDNEERWTVIQGVWVEMLCYSASRCSGYLHAKSLGDGGEFLNIIWLLLSVMGMETLADRHHRLEPPEEEEEEEPLTSHYHGGSNRSAENFSPV